MHALRTPIRAAAALALAAALVASCSSSRSASKPKAKAPSTTVVTAEKPAATSKPVPPKVAHPKQAAIALGQQMLTEALLPPGAQQSTAPAPSALRGPFSTPAIGNLVFAHQLWTTSERPYAVYQWLQRHLPRSFGNAGTGGGTSDGKQSWEVDDSPAVKPENTSYAELEFGISGPKLGPAVVRVDSVVGWTDPRPADEYVPARDGVVTVSGVHTYAPGMPVGRSVATTDPKLVGPIVRAFNQLRIAPPNESVSCPEIDSRTISYRVAFATSRTSTPDIVATIKLCGGVSVVVHGHTAPTFDFTSDGAFSDAAVKVLGLDEPHFH